MLIHVAKRDIIRPRTVDKKDNAVLESFGVTDVSKKGRLLSE